MPGTILQDGAVLEFSAFNDKGIFEPTIPSRPKAAFVKQVVDIIT